MTQFHFSDNPQQRHTVRPDPGGSGVSVDGADVRVQAAAHGRFLAQLDGRLERLHAVAHGDTVHVHWRGRAWRLERVDPLRGAGVGGSGGAGASLAPMPGVVVSVLAEPGQRVREGDALLVIESMKLQTTLTAECDGILAEVCVAVGQTFQRGAVLARVAPDAAGEGGS